MDETDPRPAVLVNVRDSETGELLLEQAMDYEVPDFLRLRVSAEVAARCVTEPA